MKFELKLNSEDVRKLSKVINQLNYDSGFSYIEDYVIDDVKTIIYTFHETKSDKIKVQVYSETYIFVKNKLQD